MLPNHSDKEDVVLIPKIGNVVVQFGATWCGPCKQIRPLAEELARTNRAQFIYVDIESCVDLANELNVRNLPTLIAFKDGQEMGRTGGAAPNQIRTVINNCF